MHGRAQARRRRARGRTRSRSTPPRRAGRGPRPSRSATRALDEVQDRRRDLDVVDRPACVTQVPSCGAASDDCPSRRPRRISKTKNGFPSDFVSDPRSRAPRRARSERSASLEERGTGPSARGARSAMRVVWREPRRVRRATVSSMPGRVVPTRRMRCPGTAIASDGKSARPSSGAKWRSSMSTTVGPLGGERARRVDEARLERVLRQRLGAAAASTRRAGAPRSAGHEEPRRAAGTPASVSSSASAAEVLAVRRA